MMQNFQRLKVWEKAHALALDVYRVAGELPRKDGAALTSQLRRAVLSIPANIAEGCAKGSDAEFRRFLTIAMGSASETEYHLLVARDVGALDNDIYDALSTRTIEVKRMLHGLMKRLKEKTRPA